MDQTTYRPRATETCDKCGHRTFQEINAQGARLCAECQIAPAPVAKFEKILELEDDVRGTRLTTAAGTYFWMRDRAAERLPLLKAKLSAMIDALTPEEMAQFGAYRKQALSGESA